MNDFSKLDFSYTSRIELYQEEYFGLNITLTAYVWGEVVLIIDTVPSNVSDHVVVNHNYHYRDWERLGTESILEYWKGQIYSGEIWE